MPNLVQRVWGVFNGITGGLLGLTTSGESPYFPVNGSFQSSSSVAGVNNIRNTPQGVVTYATAGCAFTPGDQGGGTFQYLSNGGKGCTFIGSISGSTVTVSSIIQGSLAGGQIISNGSQTFSDIIAGGGSSWTLRGSYAATGPQVFCADDGGYSYIVGLDGGVWERAGGSGNQAPTPRETNAAFYTGNVVITDFSKPELNPFRYGADGAGGLNDSNALIHVGQVLGQIGSAPVDSWIGAALPVYPITSLEIADSVNPADYNFRPGDQRRYAAGQATIQDVFVGGANNVASRNLQRTANYSGVVSGFDNTLMKLESDVTACGLAYEWTLATVMNNSSSTGQNAAFEAQGNKVLSTSGPTWAATCEARDLSGAANPTTGLVALEVDMRASGTDSNFNRAGVDVVFTRYPVATGTTMHGFCGVRVQNGGDNQAIPDNCFLIQASQFGNGFAISSSTTGVWGINFQSATFTSGAMALAQGQPIVFDTLTNANKLLSQGAGIDHLAGVTLANRLLAAGGLQVGGSKVVGSQIPGYGTPTGGSHQPSFAAGSITLPNLAAAVAQLIIDLETHGLIST